ncbi:MAG: hypothetical protein NZ853_02010 [Leptospiraceae bacterium]|nr:hypothetical protein [Leptospiraceae bacterium]MDW7975999.1 hypothetical protein [Leptospiraceae bacterium]
MKKILLFLFTLLFHQTLIFSHSVSVKMFDAPSKVFQIQFSDGTYYAFEKCEMKFLVNNEYRTIQVIYTNESGKLAFYPEKTGKHRLQCFREDGHGVFYEFDVKEITATKIETSTHNYSEYYGVIAILVLLGIGVFYFLKKRTSSSLTILMLFFTYNSLLAHHGIASLGSVGIRGPGAAVETSAQGVLPQNTSIFLLKYDEPVFKTYTPERDEEIPYNRFLLYGLGYGFTSYFSVYAFIPYNEKVIENNQFNTSGFADLSIYAVLGFKYDETFYWNPSQESLDDLQDYHFSVYAGTSLPTGNPNVKNVDNEIDPGFSLGFGKPYYILGGTISKFYDALTWNFEVSYLMFQSYRYANNIEAKFGDEFRGNLALIYRFYFNEKQSWRFDGFLEFNYLKILPDEEKGVSQNTLLQFIANQTSTPINQELILQQITFSKIPPWKLEETLVGIEQTSFIPPSNIGDVVLSTLGLGEEPSGTEVLYLTPGFRVYFRKMSLGLGVKFPVYSNPNQPNLTEIYIIRTLREVIDGTPLDVRDILWEYKILEKHLYQGAEGTEKYRLILSLSFII